MKLKCLPEDFQVTELTDRPTHGRGSFAIYRLTKRSLGTPEAIDAILWRWNLARQQVSYGGLTPPSSRLRRLAVELCFART